MLIIDEIREILKKNFSPAKLIIIDESLSHLGHKLNEVPRKLPSHLVVHISSEKFIGLTSLERHQMVYKLIAHFINKEQLHSLSIRFIT